MVWYYVFSQDSATGIGYEYVVLQADAAEIAVLLYLVVVEELHMHLLGFPFVNKGRDEVDSGLIGHYKTGLEASAAAQTVGSELC